MGKLWEETKAWWLPTGIGEGDSTTEHGGTLWSYGNDLYLDFDDGTWLCIFQNEYTIVTLKGVNFTLCKYYLHKPDIKNLLSVLHYETAYVMWK